MSAPAFPPRGGVENPSRLTLVGLALLPVVLAVVLSWSLGTPEEHLDRVTAAVVNDDQPVQVNGQTVPLGRELAGQLIGGAAGVGAPDDPGPDATATPAPGAAFTWVLTNDADAAAGLDDGRYVAVVTIPPSFSADATSFSGDPADAVQASVTIETTPTTAFLDPALTDVVVTSAVATLNTGLTERYLGQVYDAFNQIHDSLAQAADGADQLAVGAGSLSTGADELASGAGTLSRGLDELNAGAQSLTQGLQQLDRTVQPLPGLTSDLAAGSRQVAGAVDSAAAAVTAVALEFAEVVADICTTTGPICDRAQQALQELQDAAAAARALALGADEVAAGNALLADAMPPLVSGIDDAAGGAAQVSSGTAQSASGGQSVASGADGVAEGAGQVDAGAAELADGLDQAVAEVPTYTADDITVLSKTVSQPVTTAFSLPPDGSQSVPLFVVVALWFGGLITALALTPVPSSRLLTADSSLRIGARALLVPAVIGGVQGAVMSLALVGLVDMSATARAGFFGASIVIGAVFAVLNLGIAALFGGIGRALAAVVGVIALVVGVSSTVPAVLAGVAGFLPTGPARDLLLATMGFGSPVAILPLLLWGLVGIALELAGVARYRSGRAASAPV